MHRVSRAPPLTCTAPNASRFYSTAPPARTRVPLKKWGDLVIPSRQEVIDLKAKRANTDINYLKFENEKSLAARLARPTIDITLARQQVQETPAPISSIVDSEELSDDLSESSEMPNFPPGPLSDSATVRIMISERREARLKREREHLAMKERAEAERVQYEELRLARAAHKKQVEQEKKAKARAAVLEFQPLGQQAVTPNKPVVPALDERRAQLAKLAAGLAAKRRLEREEREKEDAESGSVDRRSSRTPSRRPESSFAKHMEYEDLQEPSENYIPGDFLPKFEDAEMPAGGIELLKKITGSKPYIEDYSKYVFRSTAKVFATPPDEVDATELAHATLSHRRDVSLPQRHHSLELIRKALARTSASKTKAKVAA